MSLLRNLTVKVKAVKNPFGIVNVNISFEIDSNNPDEFEEIIAEIIPTSRKFNEDLNKIFNDNMINSETIFKNNDKYDIPNIFNDVDDKYLDDASMKHAKGHN